MTVPIPPDAVQIAAVRGILARFDWEHDDRQYALEEIDRIVTGGQDPAQLATLTQVIADAIEYRTPGADCTACDDDDDALCADHAADLDRTDAYLVLAAEFGIELGQ